MGAPCTLVHMRTPVFTYVDTCTWVHIFSHGYVQGPDQRVVQWRTELKPGACWPRRLQGEETQPCLGLGVGSGSRTSGSTKELLTQQSGNGAPPKGPTRGIWGQVGCKADMPACNGPGGLALASLCPQGKEGLHRALPPFLDSP